MVFSVRDKVTVITGGSSGIGEAAARRFQAAGARVCIAARRDASALADELGALFVACDISQESDVRRLVGQVVDRFGRIDVLLNNAGHFGRTASILERTADEMRYSFEVNALGAMHAMKHVVPHMRPGSAIINTSSLGGLVGMPGYSDYAASKFALNGLTLVAAMEFGPLGIRVNAICPASVRTPMLTGQDGAEAEIALCRTTSALDRIIEPEEVAAMMHYLASDDCPTVTGQLITLDAGMRAGYSEASIEAILKAPAAHATGG